MSGENLARGRGYFRVRLALGQILLLCLPLLSLFALFSRRAPRTAGGRKRLASSGKRRGVFVRAGTYASRVVHHGAVHGNGVERKEERKWWYLQRKKVSFWNSEDDVDGGGDDERRPRAGKESSGASPRSF